MGRGGYLTAANLRGDERRAMGVFLVARDEARGTEDSTRQGGHTVGDDGGGIGDGCRKVGP